MSANLMIVEDERVRGAVRPATQNEGYDVAVAEEAEAALAHPCATGVPGATIIAPRPGGGAGQELFDPRIVAVVRGLGYRLDVQL
ncbi:hypothetical protein [Nocardia testacea]|uniref:Response regulatory domain-containing protein n=1 Tax=Nocardia testacea TaxID=248551 RepID=A0ABW7VXP3_9NOCA